jgi:type VI protein secretion system component VasF
LTEPIEQSPLTDSPWFWALAFSLMGLLALAAVGFSGKYQKRQAKIELQYQARERVAEKLTAENNPAGHQRTDDLEARRPFTTPGNNLITLWPLAVLLGIVAVVAATMLYRGSRAVRSTELAQGSGSDTTPDPP